MTKFMSYAAIGCALGITFALSGCASESNSNDTDGSPVQSDTSGSPTSTAPSGTPPTPSATPTASPTAQSPTSTPTTPTNPTTTSSPTTPSAPTSPATTPGPTATPTTPAPEPTEGGGGGTGNSEGGAGGTETGAGGMAGSSSGGGGGAGGSDEGDGGSGGSESTDEDPGQSAGCGTSRTLMNGRRTIQSGGRSREYILRVPDNYDADRPYRLIFAFHWLSGNANQVANGGNGGSTEDPYYGLWDLAENSTIFVAPEGLDAGWANTNGRDIDLTDAILAEVQDDLCIDTTRIFSTGFSYGGGMSFALACARADVFRGVALYAGAQLSGCSGGETPIAYFHAHGVGDSVLNISQGRTLRDRYVRVNGCTAQNPTDPARNSGTHTCTSYEGCSEGYPVRWCAHGGDHNPTEKDSGQAKSWVPGEAWNFISQF